MFSKSVYCVVFVTCLIVGYDFDFVFPTCEDKMVEVFAWKQMEYNFDGVIYSNDTNYKLIFGGIYFIEELQEKNKFYIKYNNVPIGLEVYKDKAFITVPRRRFGIPSTLNYVPLSRKSPTLMPYPSTEAVAALVSVYRPRVDACDRLWVVDTGLLEVPDNKRQIQRPAILVYNLNTDSLILRYELKPTDLVNERTTGGLTSITVDIVGGDCDNAFAYINDLATNGLIVFSLRQRNSWRIEHPSFIHDPDALNFTVAGHTINWKDGLFSIALIERSGKRTALYHPLVSTHEFEVETDVLKNNGDFGSQYRLAGDKGPLSQSANHDFHSATSTVIFANVARDAILCWNVNRPLTSENMATVVQDHHKLVYISDLKIVGDDVWLLVNQIPRFVYSKLNPNEVNFNVHKAKVEDLIKGTVCEK